MSSLLLRSFRIVSLLPRRISPALIALGILGFTGCTNDASSTKASRVALKTVPAQTVPAQTVPAQTVSAKLPSKESEPQAQPEPAGPPPLAPHTFHQPGEGGLNTPAAVFATAMQAPRGYPAIADIDRLRPLELSHLPPALRDENLLTYAPCAPGSVQGCRLPLRIAHNLNNALLRVYLGGFTPQGRPLARQPATIIELRKGEKLLSSSSMTETGDYLHLALPKSLQAGDYELVWTWRQKASNSPDVTKRPLVVSQLTLSSLSPRSAWDYRSLVVRATTPFFGQMQSTREKALSAWLDQLTPELKFERRVLGSRVLPVPNTPYVLVERTRTAFCPGVYHNYGGHFLVLNQRTGLLTVLNEKSFATRHFSYFPQQSEVQILEGDGAGLWLRRRVLSHRKGVLSLKPLKQDLELGLLSLPRGSAIRDTFPVEPTCKEQSVLLNPADRALIKLHPSYEGRFKLQQCSLNDERQLFVASDICSTGPANFVMTQAKGAKLNLLKAQSKLQKNYDEVLVRKLPSGQWIASTLEGDRGHLYLIKRDGALQHLSDYATLAITSAAQCRCSA